MANVINTRIQLKYDSLSNWNTSTFKPLKGEICIAKVDVTQPENGLLQPIMFKVGDGDHTFAELGWTSAKAADVYAWAKAAELPVDDTLATEGKFVVGFDWEGDKLIPKFRDFVTEINDTNKDKLDAPTTKAVKTYVDGKIADVVAQGTVVAAGDGIDVAQNGNIYTVSHEDTSNVANVTAVARTYITGLTFDEFGHVTGTTVGAEEDQDLSNYKTKQTAVVDPTASGEAATFIDTIAQDANGVITVTKKTVHIPHGNVTDFDDGVKEVAYTKGEVDALVQGAKDYADNNDDNETFEIDYNKDTKKITLTGSKGTNSEIDATDFVVDGIVDTVVLNDENDLVITFNTTADGKTKTPITVPLDKLIDVYTIEGTKTATIDTTASTNGNKHTVSATVIEGSLTNAHIAADAAIARTKLADDVQTSLGLADDAVQEITTGSANGTISVDGTDVAVKGLGTMAYEAAADYKTKQTAVDNPTANGTASAFIDSITQNENGEIVVTKKNMNIPSFYYQEGEGLIFGDNKVQLQSSNLYFSYGYDESGWMDTSGNKLKIEVSVIDKTNLDTEINESLELANTAIQADDLHPVATSGSIYDLEEVHTTIDATIAGGNYLIFNCGSASVNI